MKNRWWFGLWRWQVGTERNGPIHSLGPNKNGYPLQYFFFFFIYINVFNWRLITLQYCSGFCHTLTWISHGCTCVPHPEPPCHLPPHPIPRVIPMHQPRAPSLMHRTWTGIFLLGRFHGQKSLSRLQSMELPRVRHDWATNILTFSL